MTWKGAHQHGQQILLHVRPEQLGAFRSTKKRLTPLGEFSANPDGYTAFTHFLANHQNNSFVLLADNDDETTVVSLIPSLSGKNRKALIRRRMDTFFPELTLRTHAPLGIHKGKTRQEKFLFSALTRPSYLAPWLTCLGEAESSVIGIYTPGQLDERILQAIPGQNSKVLLVTCNKNSIRQSLLINGHRHFSRTSILPPGEPGDQAFLIQEEVEHLSQYLAAEEILPSGDRPSSIFIAPKELASNLSASGDDVAVNSGPTQILENNSITTACGLDANTPWAHTALALLAQHRPRAQFANPEILKNYRLRQLANTLIALASGLLLVCSTYSGWALLETRSLLQETQALVQESLKTEARYAEIAKTLPTMTMPLETILALSKEHQSILSQRHDLGELLAPLSHALHETSAIQITRITWQPTDLHISSLSVEGSITIETDRPQQAQAEFNSFLTKLRNSAGLSTSLIASPFEFSAGQDFKSNHSKSETSSFKLRLDAPSHS